MTDYHLSFKATDKERLEHVERLQALATQIAGKVAGGEALMEWERDFAAVALREWAHAYSPKRPAGQEPKFPHEDAALHYALLRHRGLSRADALGEVSDDLEKSEAAVWKAIKPLLPDAYAHLGLSQEPNSE